MKTILVTLLPGDDIEAVIDVAVGLGHSHNSYLVGYMPIPGLTYMNVVTPEVMVPLDDHLQREAMKQRPAIKATFETRLQVEGLPGEFRSDVMDDLDLGQGISAQARRCDLVIVRQHTRKGKVTASDAGEIADLVMASGRPILVVPAKPKRHFNPSQIMVAYDGSREASRAVFDSLPILQMANSVEIVWINPKDTMMGDVDVPGAEIANVLARQGVTVTTHTIQTRKTPSRAMSEHIKATKPDLLVMGAYGQSRLRERVLGGMTEHMLRFCHCALLISN